MTYNPIDLFYFVFILVVAPFILLLIWKLNKKEKHLLIIIVLGLFLFYVRIMLVVYRDLIGIMPYIFPDIIFYTLLTIFGVIFSIFYVIKVEKKSFAEIGFSKEHILKNIGFGLISFLPLIAMFPVVLLLGNVLISMSITWEKIVLGIEFGLILGGFYEEVMFRGIIQNHFMKIITEKKAVLLTAGVFIATHMGYLPFTGFGIFYIFLSVMALLLSWLRLKCNQISCAILHGGIVFILALFV
jgi:membrane protease YdiL (CAAX protease family)